MSSSPGVVCGLICYSPLVCSFFSPLLLSWGAGLTLASKNNARKSFKGLHHEIICIMPFWHNNIFLVQERNYSEYNDIQGLLGF